jgi:DNA-binding MarR family transcriptional regulator
MLKVTTSIPAATSEPTDGPVDRIQTALQIVARSITLFRVHERLLQAAGVRLDRAGAALLHKLHAHGSALRVTELADLLGVDAPVITRKVQRLEQDGLVVRHADPDDRRATRIELTTAGRRTLKRMLDARRAWLERLFEDWGASDLAAFASLLGRFACALEHDVHDVEDARGI